VYDAHVGIFGKEMEVIEFDQEYFLSKVHPTDRQRVKLNWRHMLESQDDDYSIEYRILNNQNEYIWVHSDGKVMERDTNSRPLRISGIIRNIDEQKQKEQIIMKQTQKLIDYAFMNSHLLRGPASSVIGLVDLLSEEYNADNLRHLKDTALKLDERIHEINNMIESTEEESGIISAHIQKVSLISRDSLQSMILRDTVKDIALEMNFDLNNDLDEYLSTNEDTGVAEVVILDEDSCDDMWSFLTGFEAAHPHTPVYILASRFDISIIDRLNRISCVHGIILKSDDHHGLFEFLKTLNN
jgi:signal transduction histidine kinase